MADSQKSKRFYQGVVRSDKMEKTIVVSVDRFVKNNRFHKIIKRSKNFKVHDEHSVARVGDVIEFSEGRPVSKTKCMYLERVVSSR